MHGYSYGAPFQDLRPARGTAGRDLCQPPGHRIPGHLQGRQRACPELVNGAPRRARVLAVRLTPHTILPFTPLHHAVACPTCAGSAWSLESILHAFVPSLSSLAPISLAAVLPRSAPPLRGSPPRLPRSAPSLTCLIRVARSVEWWLMSTVDAENELKIPGEGITRVAGLDEDGETLLSDAAEAAEDLLFGVRIGAPSLSRALPRNTPSSSSLLPPISLPMRATFLVCSHPFASLPPFPYTAAAWARVPLHHTRTQTHSLTPPPPSSPARALSRFPVICLPPPTNGSLTSSNPQLTHSHTHLYTHTPHIPHVPNLHRTTSPRGR